MEEVQRIILVHYHEIGLKGRNRGVFEKRLQKNLEALLGAYPVVTIHRISGRLLVFLREGTTLEVANQCTDAILGVPGVARASCGFKCDLDIEVMGRAACIALAEAEPFSTFKVSARRNHTVFPIDSMQMNRDIGEVLCERFPEKRVQMKGQDVTVGVEAVEGTAYVYARSVRGIGGLPVGSSGKVVCLLSSGIDSPVATWRMARRGAVPIGVHFSGRPQTSDASEDLVDDIAGRGRSAGDRGEPRAGGLADPRQHPRHERRGGIASVAAAHWLGQAGDHRGGPGAGHLRDLVHGRAGLLHAVHAAQPRDPRETGGGARGRGRFPCGGMGDRPRRCGRAP